MLHAKVNQAIHHISQHLLGKEHQIKLALSCLLANGHLLIEDLPGMGKTTLSHALANSLGLGFSRIQFTSDLLPADVLGFSTFDHQKQDFRFHPGPIFSPIVLADEINRASPKTQSALLEAMEEGQVSVDGETHPLPAPFFVIATQNPLHQSGTYPLPESQLDRFLMRIQLGYPSWEAEKQMLRGPLQNNLSGIPACLSQTELTQVQQHIRQVYASDAILEYVLRLSHFSRESDLFANALSPRASKGILQAARSWAWIDGREHVMPEDVQAVLPCVAEHRLRSDVAELGQNTPLSQRLLDAIDPLAA